MNAPSKVAPTKRATNVSLRSDLIEEAKRLNVNVSQACEAGLSAEVARARADEWRAANREAIDYWNAYVDKHGLPLARYRQF